jgi:ribosomal protein S13
MTRLLGVDIPGNKQLPYAFTHIFGIGRKVVAGL